MQVGMQLAGIHKNNLTCAEYFSKMKALGDIMASASAPLQDDEQISCILAGLDAEYNPLVASIMTRVDSISLNDLYAHLLSFEM